jgi:hypothetical protein
MPAACIGRSGHLTARITPPIILPKTPTPHHESNHFSGRNGFRNAESFAVTAYDNPAAPEQIQLVKALAKVIDRSGALVDV